MFDIGRNKKKKRIRRNSRGQGISEYGAMIAFVAVLVALCFNLTTGHLGGAICAAFSAVSSQLNNMSNEANAAS
jgi:Flp pilus assembly pilin Flp